MRNTLTTLFLFAALSLQAAYNETFIVVTNAPTTNGMTLVVNGDTRTFTNSTASSPSTLILTNSTIGGVASNLFSHISATKFASLNVQRSGTNAVKLAGNATITASLSGNWGYVSNLTATTTDDLTIRVPMSNVAAASRTNMSSLLTLDLAAYGTNNFSMHSILVSNLFRLATNNTVSGSNTFTGTNLFSHMSNRFTGTHIGLIGNLSNGVIISPTIGGSPTSSNLINYGNAFSSPGSAADSEEFGEGATATGVASTAIGYQSAAAGEGSFAGGGNSGAHGTNSIAIGNISAALGTSTIAIGVDAEAATNSAIALGSGTRASHVNSVAIGTDSASTKSNQVVLGSATVREILTPGYIIAEGGITNLYSTGTNNFAGDLAYQVTNVTSLANGNNANLNFAGKIYSRISGPTAAFSINGIAGGRDGRLLILQNISGQTVTIANDSGVDPTAANRILTGTASDVSFTNASQPLWFIYDPAQSRWILQNMVGTASVGLSAVSNVGGGFGIFDSNAGAVAQLRTLLAGNGIAISTNGTNVSFRLSDGDKGDITVSASGATWTIDNDAVTYAKMQNVSAASRLLGRGDSGAGDVQEITLGSGLSMSGTTLSASGGGGGSDISTNNWSTNIVALPTVNTWYTNGSKRSFLSVTVNTFSPGAGSDSGIELWVLQNSVTNRTRAYNDAGLGTAADVTTGGEMSMMLQPNSPYMVTNTGSEPATILYFNRIDW